MTGEALAPGLRDAILDDLDTGAVLEVARWLDGHGNETRRAAALTLQRLLVDDPWDPLGAGIASAERQQEALGRVLEILRDEPGWTAGEAVSAVDVLGHRTKLYASAIAGIEFALAVCGDAPAAAPASDLSRALEGLLGAIEEPNALDEVTKAMVAAQVRRLLPDITAEDALLAPLSCGDRFGPRARQALRRVGVSEADGAALERLRRIDVRKPDKWVAAWVTRAGVAEAEPLVRLLLETAVGTDLAGTGLDDTNTRICAAACYAAASGGYPWAADVLGRVAEWGLAWVLGQGVAPRVARAAIDSLGHLGTESAVLALLDVDKRYGSRKQVRTQLDAALALTTRALGRTPEQVADRSAADAGLDTDTRQRLLPVGECTAILRLDGLVPTVRWRHGAGRETATPLRSARENHPADVAAAKRLLRELREAVRTHTSRLETALVSERTWPLAEWEDTFLRHAVLAALAERTIWSVSTSTTVEVGLAMPSERSLLTLEGAVPLPTGAGEVRMWHPMSGGPAEVGRWRQHLLDEGLDQPVRQAFRETYARDTAALSRLTEPLFVAGQLEALMRSSGWKVGALGGWEHGDRALASKISPSDDLRIAVWIAGADAERAGPRFGPTYCTLASVQFERVVTAVDGRPLRVDEVPVVFFSEALRDLDLFSNVAAVGSALPADLEDPVAWAFWSAAAFSPLNASGEIRRGVVAHLLPKWPFANRAEISDRWLVIHGPQPYRVHFGTGQVLAGDSPMQVAQPAPPKSSRIALPIEDRRLRQIVDAATVLAAGPTESR